MSRSHAPGKDSKRSWAEIRAFIARFVRNLRILSAVLFLIISLRLIVIWNGRPPHPSPTFQEVVQVYRAVEGHEDEFERLFMKNTVPVFVERQRLGHYRNVRVVRLSASPPAPNWTLAILYERDASRAGSVADSAIAAGLFAKRSEYAGDKAHERQLLQATATLEGTALPVR